MIYVVQQQRVGRSSVEGEESSKRVIEEQIEQRRKTLNSARQQARAQNNQQNSASPLQAAQSITVSQAPPISKEQLRTQTHQAMRELRSTSRTTEQMREAVIARLQSNLKLSRNIALQYMCTCEQCQEDDDDDDGDDDDDDDDSE